VGSVGSTKNTTKENDTVKMLGQLLRQARQGQGLGLEQVACRLGYRNVTKGVRKLKVIEATGTVSDDLLVKLAEVLGIDWVVLEEVIDCLRQVSELPVSSGV
jgi:transcriptional regulator with XRE-family HTH domain